MPRAKRTQFLDNPWNLTFAEMQTLVLLPDYSRKQMAEQFGHDSRAIGTRVSRMLPQFNAENVGQAMVHFDRWWQNYQRLHADDGLADEARELLFSPLSDRKEK